MAPPEAPVKVTVLGVKIRNGAVACPYKALTKSKGKHILSRCNIGISRDWFAIVI